MPTETQQRGVLGLHRVQYESDREKQLSNFPFSPSTLLSLYLLTAYAKNSVTILDEPLSVMVLRVVVAWRDMAKQKEEQKKEKKLLRRFGFAEEKKKGKE